MPTGYTAAVIDGEIDNASDFARLCAHAFMFHMRDDRMGSPLRYPERFDSYYAEELPKSIAELSEWDALSEEGRYARWSEYAIKQAEAAKEAKETADRNMQRLSKVLYEVKRIQVPDTHKNFKEFMIEQLQSTIDFDGKFNEKWYRVVPYSEWVDAQRGAILRSIEVATEGLLKAEENNQASRKWIGTLATIFNLEIEDA